MGILCVWCAVLLAAPPLLFTAGPVISSAGHPGEGESWPWGRWLARVNSDRMQCAPLRWQCATAAV